MVVHTNEDEQEQLVAIVIDKGNKSPNKGLGLARDLIEIPFFVLLLIGLDFFSGLAHEHDDCNEQKKVDEECVSTS